jgi:translation initiation factor 2 subunit 3
VLTTITLKYHSLKRSDLQEHGVSENEPMILSIGTLTVVGYVKSAKRDTIKLDLKHPVCAEKGSKIAIMRNVSQRWKLTGYGISE